MRAEAKSINSSNSAPALLSNDELRFLVEYITRARLNDRNRRAGAELLGADLIRSAAEGDVSIAGIMAILAIFKQVEHARPVALHLLNVLIEIPEEAFPVSFTRLHVLAIAAMASGVGEDFQERVVVAFLECFAMISDEVFEVGAEDFRALQQGMLTSVLLNLLRFDFNTVDDCSQERLFALLEWILEAPVDGSTPTGPRYHLLYRLILEYGPRSLDRSDPFASKMMDFLAGFYRVYVDALSHYAHNAAGAKASKLDLELLEMAWGVPSDLFDILCLDLKEKHRAIFEDLARSYFLSRKSNLGCMHAVFNLSEAIQAAIEKGEVAGLWGAFLSDVYLDTIEHYTLNQQPAAYAQLWIISAHLLRANNTVFATLKREALAFLEASVEEALNAGQVSEYLLDALRAVVKNGAQSKQKCARKLLVQCEDVRRVPYVRPNLEAQARVLELTKEQLSEMDCSSEFLKTAVEKARGYCALPTVERISFIKKALDLKIVEGLDHLSVGPFLRLLTTFECFLSMELSPRVFEECLRLLYQACAQMPACAYRDALEGLCLRLRSIRFMAPQDRLALLRGAESKKKKKRSDQGTIVFIANDPRQPQNATITPASRGDDPFPGGSGIRAEGVGAAMGLQSISGRALQALFRLGAPASTSH